MRVTATGGEEHSADGRKVIRYGRDLEGGYGFVAVWYATQVRSEESLAWSMEPEIQWKISVSIDYIVIVDQPRGAWVASRDALQKEIVNGREQYIVRADDPRVWQILDPAKALRGSLYIESGNTVDEGYHKEAGES